MAPNPDAAGLAGRSDGLSVDVEDYFHVEAFADRIRPDAWPRFPSRVAANTRRLLELFARHGARGTFFILGWVAEREPGLVREIAAAGHEIACHSYLHQALWRLTPEAFRADTRRAVAVIADACGTRPVGYRAPTFSIVPRTLWALEILAEEGFAYDSSVFPVRHDRYGIPSAPRFPYHVEFSGGRSLAEIPPMTMRLAGRNWPVAGGGYLRILPMWFSRWATRRVRREEGRPVLIYVHPWEVDPEQPRLDGRWLSRFRHYYHLSETARRLNELLAGRRYLPLGEILSEESSRSPLPRLRPEALASQPG